MRHYPTFIAGLEFKGPDGTNRARYCLKLTSGTLVDLVLEPENTHDAEAVAVKHNGRHLGYIPRKHHWIGHAIREGHRMACAVVDVRATGMWWWKRAETVNLQVGLI